jgi:hypothetical protein
MDLSELRRRLDREMLLKALEPRRCCDARIADWLERLYHQHGGLKDSGARGVDRALGVLLDRVALSRLGSVSPNLTRRLTSNRGCRAELLNRSAKCWWPISSLALLS